MTTAVLEDKLCECGCGQAAGVYLTTNHLSCNATYEDTRRIKDSEPCKS